MWFIKGCQSRTDRGLHVLTAQQSCLSKARKRSCSCKKPKHGTTKFVSCIAAVNMGRSCEKNFHFSIQVLLKWYPFTSTRCYGLTFWKQLWMGGFGAWFEPEVQKSICTTEFEENTEFCFWRSYPMHAWESAEPACEWRGTLLGVNPDSFCFS